MSGTLLARVQPIHRGTHDSTKAYETLDIVVNAAASIAYMAVRNVPAGTALTNTDYWEKLADTSPAIKSAETAASNADAAAEACEKAVAELPGQVTQAFASLGLALIDGKLCVEVERE